MNGGLDFIVFLEIFGKRIAFKMQYRYHSKPSSSAGCIGSRSELKQQETHGTGAGKPFHRFGGRS
jgi:hypothetical protein